MKINIAACLVQGPNKKAGVPACQSAVETRVKIELDVGVAILCSLFIACCDYILTAI